MSPTQYLQMILGTFPDRKAPSFPSFILDHGKEFSVGDFPRPKGFHKGRDRYCFHNSSKAVLLDPSFVYCEGYATCALGLPVHHAWVVDGSGTVIETTWRDSGLAYFGVPFSTPFMLKMQELTGLYGILDSLFFWSIQRASLPRSFFGRSSSEGPGVVFSVKEVGMEKELTVVWITTYALTKGIVRVEGQINTVFPTMVSWVSPGGWHTTAHGKDWHRTPEAALARAEEMRKAKIASLRESLAKMETLVFSAPK